MSEFLLVSSLGVCVITLSIGIFLVSRPAMAIELQRRFYARINWRMEPISMEKELRNTRIMGGIVISGAIFLAVYLLQIRSS